MSNTATTQAPDLSTLLESINQAIAQNDEPEPAANPEHIERLERAVQLLESSLNSNTQLMQTAVAGISQVTEAISNHGNLLASLHTRQQQTWDSIQLMQNAMERLQAQVLSQVNLQAQTNSLIASQMQAFNLPSEAPATPFAQSPPTANAASTSGTIGAAASPTPNSHGLYTAASSPALTSAITVARSQMSPVYQQNAISSASSIVVNSSAVQPFPAVLPQQHLQSRLIEKQKRLEDQLRSQQAMMQTLFPAQKQAAQSSQPVPTTVTLPPSTAKPTDITSASDTSVPIASDLKGKAGNTPQPAAASAIVPKQTEATPTTPVHKAAPAAETAPAKTAPTKKAAGAFSQPPAVATAPKAPAEPKAKPATATATPVNSSAATKIERVATPIAVASSSPAKAPSNPVAGAAAKRQSLAAAPVSLPHPQKPASQSHSPAKPVPKAPVPASTVAAANKSTPIESRPKPVASKPVHVPDVAARSSRSSSSSRPSSSPKSEAAVASDRQSRRDSSVRIDESANRYYKDAGSRYSSSRRSPSRESNWSSGSSSSRHSYSRNAPQEGFSIKGRSKHALNDSDSSDNRSSKRGCTSPRLNHIIMFGSDGENSESDSESDGGIAGRLSRPSAPRSSDRGERDIGIVGASSNRNNSSYNSHSGNARGQRGGSDINSRLDYSRSQSRFFDEHGSSNEARRLYSSTYRPPERNSGATLAPRDEISTIATTITTPPRLATVIRPMDGNGNEITAERINTVMGPFFFMRLMVVTHVYRLFFDCQALIPNVRQDDFNRSITSLAGFGYWQASARDSSGMSRVMSHYVLRSSADVEYERMKRRMDIKLFKSSVIPEPLLLYYMLTMTCCKLKEIEVEVIATMFFKITGRRVETLDVATKDGVQRMPLRKLWERLSDWAIELCKFIADKTLVQDSLDQADRCYDAYITNCRRCGSNTGSRSLELDPSGSIACKMLLDDEADSRLLLGIRSDELRRINRYLVYMMGELVPPRTIRYLKQVSESFIQNG